MLMTARSSFVQTRKAMRSSVHFNFSRNDRLTCKEAERLFLAGVAFVRLIIMRIVF